MKLQLTVLLVIITSLSFAQVLFEPGYIVDQTNKRSEVFIKNVDWSNNPENFEYRLSADSNETLEGSLTNINEFGIGSSIKYVKALVDLDISSAVTGKMSQIKEPEYVKKTVFLKQLVEGEANLYSYQDNSNSRFFYSKNQGQIRPLTYKKYKVSNTEVAENLAYKKELFDNLKCESITAQESRKLKYDNGSLVDYFTKYNECSGDYSVTYESQTSKGSFHFAVKIGYFNTSLDIKKDVADSRIDGQSIDMGSSSGVRFAVEAEYVLPFNRNKWALVAEPGYQSFSSDGNILVQGNAIPFEQSVSVDYNYIDVPLSLRHYMFLSEKSKLFASVGFAFTFDFSDIIEYSETEDLDINSSANAVIGLGFVYNDKFIIEGRLNTARNITRDYAFFNSDYNSIGILLGYKFL